MKPLSLLGILNSIQALQWQLACLQLKPSGICSCFYKETLQGSSGHRYSAAKADERTCWRLIPWHWLLPSFQPLSVPCKRAGMWQVPQSGTPLPGHESSCFPSWRSPVHQPPCQWVTVFSAGRIRPCWGFVHDPEAASRLCGSCHGSCQQMPESVPTVS